MVTTEKQRPTYHFSLKPRSTGLFGLTVPATIGVLGIVIIGILVSLFWPKGAFVIWGIGLVGLAPLVIFKKDGRSGYERLSIARGFLRARRRGETSYRAGAFSAIPGGLHKLPGLASGTRLYEYVDAQGRDFGMIHMPSTNQYTIVLSAYPMGDEALEEEDIDRAVFSWGMVLTTLGETGDVDAVVSVIDTVPDSGQLLREEVTEITDASAPEYAREVMWELGQTLPLGGVRLEPRIAITFRAMTDERKRIPAEQAVEIARRLPSITAALGRASVNASPMTADEVISVVRRSYDPSVAGDLDEIQIAGESHELKWTDAGPQAADESRTHYEHDGAVSVTWEMSAAPRGAVTEQVLSRLLAPHGDVPRKRVAIVHRPHSPADAAKIVDEDWKNARTARQSERGAQSVQAVIQEEAAAQARSEQAVGHGLTRFGLLVTVTEPAGADLPRIGALVDDLAAQSRLTIRRSYCTQAAAFAASLGIGVILPDHATISSMLSA